MRSTAPRRHKGPMRTVPDSPEGIAEALEVLRSGGIVMHATETCYGIACDMTNPDAVAALFAVKERPLTQPVSALFATLTQAKEYLEWNDRAEELAAERLPGPFTMVLKLRTGAPHRLYPTPPDTDPKPPTPTVGLRLSPHPTALALVTQFGKPITTTSANLHGQENPYSAEDILTQYAERDADHILIVDSGTLEKRSPSQVVDLSLGSEVLLRS